MIISTLHIVPYLRLHCQIFWNKTNSCHIILFSLLSITGVPGNREQQYQCTFRENNRSGSSQIIPFKDYCIAVVRSLCHASHTLATGASAAKTWSQNGVKSLSNEEKYSDFQATVSKSINGPRWKWTPLAPRLVSEIAHAAAPKQQTVIVMFRDSCSSGHPPQPGPGLFHLGSSLYILLLHGYMDTATTLHTASENITSTYTTWHWWKTWRICFEIPRWFRD